MITITPSMSISEIQESLRGRGTIKFKGVFDVTKTYRLFSGTKLDLSEATFVRKAGCYVFMSYVNKNTTKYSGQRDIALTGGRIIANGSKNVSNIISLAHTNNITIKGLIIEKNVGSHAIEINSSSGIVVDDCSFKGNEPETGSEFRECIQIDFATFIALTYAADKNAPCYDDTHCNDITIKNCYFDGFNICVGTHTQTKSDKKHSGIKILDNKCNGVGALKGYGSCFKVLNFEDVTIDGNTVTGFARGVEVTSANKFYSTNSSITKVKPACVTGSREIVISNNVIKKPSKDFKVSGVYIDSKFADLVHDNIRIEKNTFELDNGISKYDIYYDNATNVIKKDNISDL